MNPAEVEVLVRNYVAAWSEPDPAERRRLLEAVWHDRGAYTDPVSQASDRAGLEAIIAEFQRRNPGATFTLTDRIYHHHGHLRFFWSLRFANGMEVPGMDYGEVSPEGQLVKIVGFF